MSSGVRGGAFTEVSMVFITSPSYFASKMLSNSVKNMENTGAGILSVGENTIPTAQVSKARFYFGPGFSTNRSSRSFCWYPSC